MSVYSLVHSLSTDCIDAMVVTVTKLILLHHDQPGQLDARLQVNDYLSVKPATFLNADPNRLPC